MDQTNDGGNEPTHLQRPPVHLALSEAIDGVKNFAPVDGVSLPHPVLEGKGDGFALRQPLHPRREGSTRLLLAVARGLLLRQHIEFGEDGESGGGSNDGSSEGSADGMESKRQPSEEELHREGRDEASSGCAKSSFHGSEPDRNKRVESNRIRVIGLNGFNSNLAP